jgi:predicted transcriptional regulator
MSKRRDKISIINDMLLSIIAKGGNIKPTHLLYKSNLSHKRMVPLIDELTKRGLLETVQDDRDSKKFYSITDEGRKFVSEFKKMKEFVDSFGF